MKPTLYWSVDTQNDFMNKDGALYVPDAESVKSKIGEVAQYAFRNKYARWGSADAHTKKDPEMKANGGMFEFHCMIGTRGQKYIPEVALVYPLYVQNRVHDESDLEKMLAHEGELIFEKQDFDVFANPNTSELIKRKGFEKVVVYGVATDYCVKYAVLGMRKLGLDVYVVEDTARAITEEGGKAAWQEMLAAGAKRTTTKEVLEGRI
ncbi:MAG: isochorismatase family protein [archaeon]